MKPGADVKSIEALRQFRAELRRYLESLHSTIDELKMQSRKAQDWVDQDRARYWPKQAKLATDGLVEARNALSRCKMTAVEGEMKSCIDEKKAVEYWVKRQHHCESQIRAVRGWRNKMTQQTDEFTTRMSRLDTYAENELPKAIASLDRMIKSLEKYSEIATPSAGPGPSSSATKKVTLNPDENSSESP